VGKLCRFLLETCEFPGAPDRVQPSPELLVEAIGDDWPTEQVDAAIELLAASEGRFPSGTCNLPVELVRAIQRERLIAAMLDAAATRGYRETNVQDVIERAGVSRPTFYEHFTNKDDCFLAAILAFARVEPQTARALIVEARAASGAAPQRRIELLDGFATCLDATARELLRQPTERSPLTAAGVVGGIEAVLYARLCRGGSEQLGDLLPSLMYFAVLPYEGQQAASEELTAAAGWWRSAAGECDKSASGSNWHHRASRRSIQEATTRCRQPWHPGRRSSPLGTRRSASGSRSSRAGR